MRLSNELRRFWAGGFLFDPSRNSVLLHLRDGNTKYNPHKWAFFGGLSEGNETERQCFVRELREEIGLNVEEDRIIHLSDYINDDLDTRRVVFYTNSDIPIESLVLGEGAGFSWVKLQNIDDLDLTELTRNDLRFFIGLIRKT